MKGTFAAGLLVLCVVTGGCGERELATASPSENYLVGGKLILTGSSTVAPLTGEIGKRFEVEFPHARIDVQSGGSSRGIADVRQGLADLGMVSRDLKAGEKDLVSFVIARDGIGIIVHESNPVERLSNEQITSIYTKKIKNWGEVGGENAPIIVVNKAEGRSTLEIFLEYFSLRNSEIGADIVIGENVQGLKTVAINSNAIGYVSIGAAEFDIAKGAPIKLLPLNGIAATADAVATGEYPLSRALNLVSRSQPEGLSEAFIAFARSAQMKPVITELGFVPVAP